MTVQKNLSGRPERIVYNLQYTLLSARITLSCWNWHSILPVKENPLPGFIGPVPPPLSISEIFNLHLRIIIRISDKLVN
jgi:hypothetical protein